MKNPYMPKPTNPFTIHTIQELVEDSNLAMAILNPPKDDLFDIANEDTTVDKDAWLKVLGKMRYLGHGFYDTDGMLFLSDTIERYMSGPTALYKGKLLESIALDVLDLKGLKNTWISEKKKIIFHSLVYQPSIPIYMGDTYIMGICSWRIRYAEIPK